MLGIFKKIKVMLKKINIDFQVLKNSDPRIFMVADSSYWEHIENKPAIIEITMPGYEKPVVHYFDKHKINIFNSVNLGVNCDICENHELAELPDGIYTITVKGSPDTFNKTKKYLRTTLFDLKLDKMILNADELVLDMSKKDLVKNIFDIKLLLRGAEANIKYDNIGKAKELLDMAMRIKGQLDNCINCK